MALFKPILRLVGTLAFAIAAVCGAASPALAANAVKPDAALSSEKAIARPFSANCVPADVTCKAWETFRLERPYPYQAILAKRLDDNTVALVLSEPAPSLPKAELEQLVKDAFGADLIEAKRLRWMIGMDGWVEDLVLRVRAPIGLGQSRQAANLLDDPIHRDRIALLHMALYGTVFGANVQEIGAAGKTAAQAKAPNLKLSAKELRDWITDSSLSWRPIDAEVTIDAEGTNARPWASLPSDDKAGVYVSDDGTLVAFRIPAALLRTATANPKALDVLRADFRRFAIATDAIVGGVWNDGRHVTILGRGRVQPVEVVPPLRFETFALLASQSRDQLQQSYERNHLFAGKLVEGEYKYCDWAPIYLSNSLIDTEFGALLNITDQMLKSWSEAGQIEYLYFDYPGKPNAFPFDKPLSDILFEKYHSQETLFNWNTAGSTVVVKLADMATLATAQTGALPITYGSDLHPGEAVANWASVVL